MKNHIYIMKVYYEKKRLLFFATYVKKLVAKENCDKT